MLSAEPSTRGKFTRKHFVFVILFILVSIVVTGFFITNQPPVNKGFISKEEKELVKKLAEEYKKNQVLPKDVTFSKIVSFKVIREYDELLKYMDADIELEDNVKFTMVNLLKEAEYWPDVSKTKEKDGKKDVAEFILSGETYYRNADAGVWFIKYVDGKESGLFLPVFVENNGFEKSTKLRFF